MMVVGSYEKTIDITVPMRKKDGGQDATKYMEQAPYLARENNSFTTHAVSASEFVSFLPPLTYMHRIEQWAWEFQRRKHNLSQEEIEALNSKIYLDLLETQNNLP